jgi:hypothetical protein
MNMQVLDSGSKVWLLVLEAPPRDDISNEVMPDGRFKLGKAVVCSGSCCSQNLVCSTNDPPHIVMEGDVEEKAVEHSRGPCVQ